MADPTGTTGPQVETTKDFGEGVDANARRWQAEIKAAQKYFERYFERAEKAVKRFRDDADEQDRRDDSDRFNVFWSTIKTLQPLVYARPPKPEAERKFKDPDPIARAAAQITERTLENVADVEAFEEAMVSARDDYLLAGRGQVWWRYIPTFGKPEKAGDGKDEFAPVVAERAEPEFVHYKDFLHSPVPLWSKVTWVARRVQMKRDALVDRFGKDLGEKVPLNQRSTASTEEDAKTYPDVFGRAAVWEIWDKTKREVVWIAEGFDQILDTKADPLKLEGFFPCPRPLYATTTTSTTVPVPDHFQWRHQLRQLDELTERISLLTEAIAVRGVYNSNLGDEIQDLLSSRAENRLIPVDNWNMLQETGGLKGNVDFLPLEQLVAALTVLREERERLKQDFYEVSGVSDIMRGNTNPKETFGAQRIKARFGSVRVEDRQAQMQNFVRANLRIAAEIAGEHFSAETIELMANWLQSKQSDEPTFKAALKLIKSDKLRGFRIDVETDSTVAPDRDAEQQRRTQFLAAVTPFLERAVLAAQQEPGLSRLLSEMLMFGVRGFSAGRQLENVFEQAMSDIEKRGGGPNPEQQAEALEVEKAKLEDMAERFRKEFEIEKARLAVEKEAAEVDIQRQKLKVEADGVALAKKQLDGAADGDMARDLEARQREIDIQNRKLDQEQQKIDDKRIDMEQNRRREILKLALDSNDDPDVLDELEAEAGEAQSTIRTAVQALATGQQSQAEAMAQLAAAQAQQGEAMIRALSELGQAMQAMAAAATAPRRLVRDDSGNIVGAEVSVQ